jgi:hypothetical protein
MSIKNLIGGAMIALVPVTSALGSMDASVDVRLTEAQSEIAELRSQVAMLNMSDSDRDISAERAKMMKALVKDVLADADTRMYLNSQQDFTLDFSGFAVTRWQYAAGGGNDSTHEFSLPYTRLEFSGDVHGLGYNVSGEWSDSTQNFDLLDAYFTGSFAGFDIKGGQFVSSFYSGYTDSPLDQVTGEYSIIATTFGQGRSQGIEVSRDLGFLNLTASYNDGFNSANGAGVANDYGFSLRADAALGYGFGVGAAVAMQRSAVDYNTYTLDASWNYNALDLNVAWVASDAGDGYSDNYGFVGTAAYQCMDNLQGFVQYEHGRAGAGGSDLNIATVGVNYDIATGVRWTTTAGYAFDAVGAGWNTGRSGWNTSSEDGQYVLGTQLSISF